MENIYQEICNKLNSMLPCAKEDISERNNLIRDLYAHGGNLYFSRKVFIDNNFDDEKIHDLVYSDKIIFVVSDDMEEHKGIVLKYKDE